MIASRRPGYHRGSVRPGQTPASDNLSSRPAFTLIEVLVVVAIIALLISILLPSLKAARERARAVACATNLRTTGMAVQYYTQANRDFYPSCGKWAESCAVYIKKLGGDRFNGREQDLGGADTINQVVEFYSCPSDPIRAATAQKRHLYQGKWVSLQYWVSYGMSGFVSFPLVSPLEARAGTNYEVKNRDAYQNEFGEVIPRSLRRTGDDRRTSDVVLMADAGDDDFGPWNLQEPDSQLQWDFDDAVDGAPTEQDPGALEVHHGDGNNFLYLDQHIEYAKWRSKKDGRAGVPKFPWRWVPIDGLKPPQ